MKVPKRRIDKAIATGRHIITMSSNRKRRAPVKSVASFVGQIISMSMVQGNLTQLMTRHISMDIILAQSWNAFIKLSYESIEQIKFLIKHLSGPNNIKTLNAQHVPSAIVYSDASKTGYAVQNRL